MIETNIKKLSVEEIMQKIKEEVERRKHQTQQQDTYTNSVELEFKKEYKNIIHKKDTTFNFKDVYEYPDFTKYHDIDFIVYLYKALLKREPDQSGLEHYLNLLRSGQKSKTEIVSLIRYSKEGKEKDVKLLGSKKRYIFTLLSSLPVVGYIFKTLTFFLRIPTFIQRMNVLENYISQESRFHYENSILLEKELNENVNDVKKIKFILKKIREKL